MRYSKRMWTVWLALALCTLLGVTLLLMAPARAMGDNLIGQVLDGITQRLSDAWDWIWDPLWQWYAVGFGILIAVMIVAYFLPFKWVRAGLGAFLLLVGAYIAGGRHMRGTFKKRLEDERARVKELEDLQRANRRRDRGDDNEGGGGFGGFFNWR